MILFLICVGTSLFGQSQTMYVFWEVADALTRFFLFLWSASDKRKLDDLPDEEAKRQRLEGEWTLFNQPFR